MGIRRFEIMRHRFTIKQLDEWSDAEILRVLLNERLSDATNVYAPMSKRLVRIREKLERNEPLSNFISG